MARGNGWGSAAPPKDRRIVAAGRRYRLDDPTDVRELKLNRPDWQAEAWDYYDAIGEVRFGMDLLGGLATRCIPRLCWYPEPNAPAFLFDEYPQPAPPNYPSPALIAQAEAELARIVDGVGGTEELFGLTSIGVAVVGESWVIAYYEQETTITPETGEPVTTKTERWGVFSPEAIDTQSTPAKLKRSPNESGVPLSDEAVLGRIWRPHPRWPATATSHMRAILEDCEQLILLRRSIRGAHRSQLNAGILVVASELDDSPRTNPDTAPSDEPRDSSFIEDLTDAMIEPIKDEAAAASVAPMVVTAPSSVIAESGGVVHVPLSRPIDDTALAERDQILRAVANGLPLPAEAVLGVGDVNHWSAWQISEDLFQSGVAPTLQRVCDGIVDGVFWPLLETVGIPPEEYRKVGLWYDPTAVIAKPDQSAVIAEAHARFAVSDERYRRALPDTDDADAPSKEELALRVAQSRMPYAYDATREINSRYFGVELPPDSSGGNLQGFGSEQPSNSGEPSAGPPNEGVPPTEARLAAGTRSRVRAARAASDRMGEIERGLMARLLVVADAAVRRAVERVGAQARTRTRGNPAVQASIDGQPNRLVPRILGPQVLHAALDGTEEATIRAALDADLGPVWHRYLTRGMDGMLTILSETTDTPEGAAWFTAAREHAAAAIDTSATLFVDLTIADTIAAFAEHDLAEQLGEVDPTLSVRPETIRRALAVAGGADPTAPVQPGITGGPIITSAAAEAGLVVTGYLWVYGDPSTRGAPFPPHEALSGRVFASMDDDALSNHSTWPAVSHYFPGDHPYCQCDTEAIYAPAPGFPVPPR